jgi:hypothetical protein
VQRQRLEWRVGEAGANYEVPVFEGGAEAGEESVAGDDATAAGGGFAGSGGDANWDLRRPVVTRHRRVQAPDRVALDGLGRTV